MLFFDAGQVWERADAPDWELSKSLGLGVRADLPVRVIRLDVAFPLDRREADDGWQLHGGFGSGFWRGLRVRHVAAMAAP